MLETLAPVLQHGRTVWDRSLLPADEYEGRRLAIDEVATARSCAAVVAFDMPHAPGLAAYLTGYRPTAALATLVALRGEGVVLIAGLGGGRDHPFIRSTACVDDVRWYRTPAEGILAVLGEHAVSGGPVGLVGAGECLDARGYDRLVAALEPHGLVSLDEEIHLVRRRKRERELVALRRGASVLSDARRAITGARLTGSSVHESLTSGERTARYEGCRDLRVLVGDESGAMRPWPSSRPDRLEGSTGSVYLAAELLGYWSETSFSLSPAGDGLASLIDDLARETRDGTTGSDMRRIARCPGGTRGLEATGIGLALKESPMLTGDVSSVAHEGDVLAVRIVDRGGGGVAVATGCLVVGADSSTVLGVTAGRSDLGARIA